MNEQVAYALINAELRRLQEFSYSNLSALIGKVETKELVAADDGGWRAFKPLTGDFAMRPDGSLV